jgi:hypothetical protein
MTRAQLIDRKHQVIAQIQRLRREREALAVKDDRSSRRRVAALDDQLDRLMGEEARLRIAIDQTRE